MADSSVHRELRLERPDSIDRSGSVEKSGGDRSKLNAAADDEALELKQTLIENVREEIKHVN